MAAIEAKAGSGGETGWISIGWTKKAGLMAPADAVVGNLAGAAPNNVLAYAMTGKTVAKVKKAAVAAVKLSAKSVVTSSDGGKIVKFTRMGKGGLGPVNYLGNNNMIWAYSDTQAFTSHSNRGSVIINLACKV
ncbi:unnamed protein product [Closterium sp. Naga37s-1]|nr:unnamed protein product [Closterium sp. Naga37s-1]